MRHVLLHARAHAREALRQPAYWLPSLGFPLFFFLLFGLGMAHQLERSQGLGSEYVITPFLLFSTLNVTLMSLAGGVAQERATPWEQNLRMLPVSGMRRFLGRVLFVLAFSIVSWLPVLAVAGALTDIRLEPALWPLWLLAVALGSVPFALLGIALGYLCPAQSAAVVANMLFLLLSFAGGLFVPPDQLPAALAAVAPYLPSNEYLHLVLAAVGRAQRLPSPTWTLALLPAWTALLAWLASWAFRRDEGIRYG